MHVDCIIELLQEIYRIAVNIHVYVTPDIECNWEYNLFPGQYFHFIQYYTSWYKRLRHAQRGGLLLLIVMLCLFLDFCLFSITTDTEKNNVLAPTTPSPCFLPYLSLYAPPPLIVSWQSIIYRGLWPFYLLHQIIENMGITSVSCKLTDH